MPTNYKPLIQSGFGVGISGQHVYVESGVYLASGVHVVADIAESGMGVQIQSGAHVVVSGQPVTISGDHVYIESGAHVVANVIVIVSNITVDISGDPVTISGDHVFVESGAFVTTQPDIGISGTVRSLISGDHVFVESGVYLASGVHVTADIAESGIGVQIQSGAHVQISGQPVTISGDHVFVESGVYLASGMVVEIAGGINVSGSPVKISGESVWISGQHVFVESGVYLASGVHVTADIAESGIGVQIQSGAGVLISGQHVYVESGTYLASGLIDGAMISGTFYDIARDDSYSGFAQKSVVYGALANTNYTALKVDGAGALYVLISGQGVLLTSGIGVLISGQQTSFSGHGAMYPFNDREIIDSQHAIDFVDISGEHFEMVMAYNLAYNYCEGDIEPLHTCDHFLMVTIHSGDSISVQSGKIDVQSGLYLASGVHVVADIAESGMGVQIQSGAHVQISGQHVFVESGVYLASGMVVEIAGGINVSGSPVKISGESVWISGQHVFVESGVYLASGVHVTADIAESGMGVQIQSGAHIQISGQPVTISGDHVYVESGVFFASGIGVITAGGFGSGDPVWVASGEIHVLSGTVDIEVPTSILINPASGNPQVIGAISGGVILHSNAVISVIVKALGANSGDIYLGGDTAGHMPFTAHGLLLEPGEAINVDIDNIGRIHAYADVSGDKVSYLGNK